jgi:hypothetical protein
LKPEAPEFVPITPKPDERKPSKLDAKNSAKEQKKLEKREKEQQKQQRKATPSVGKKSGKPFGRHDGAEGKQASESSHSVELTQHRHNGIYCQRTPFNSSN